MLKNVQFFVRPDITNIMFMSVKKLLALHIVFMIITIKRAGYDMPPVSLYIFMSRICQEKDRCIIVKFMEMFCLV